MRGRLIALVAGLAAAAAAIAEQPATLGLTRHDPYAATLNLLVWVAVGIAWIVLAWRSASGPASLWRAPSALFRGGIAIGTAAIALGRLATLLAEGGGAPAVIVSSLEAALYGLGVVALASLAAFASSRSLLRPVLAGTRPPVGARDIPLRTRVLVATTGSSFATAGILLNVLIDFDTTPPATLAAFLGTAAALVVASALIGLLVGEDAARGVDDVTRRMRELAEAGPGERIAIPIVAADEIGDLTIAAAELERRIRRDEAEAAATAERERIARELHDGVAKSVSVLALEVATLAAGAPEPLRPPLARVEHLARILAEELRAIVQEFRTRGDAEPFADELQAIVEEYDATVDVSGPLDRVGTLARFEVLRVVEEALSNAQRHAGARRIAARVAVEDRALHLTVDDDGAGIGDVAWSDLASRGHFGLLGMRERAVLLGGELRVTRGPAGGTRLTLDVPLNGTTA